MKLKDIYSVLKANRLKVTIILLVLIFPVVAPYIAQKYYDYSAVMTSLVITVLYFVVWRVYENREKIRCLLHS